MIDNKVTSSTMSFGNSGRTDGSSCSVTPSECSRRDNFDKDGSDSDYESDHGEDRFDHSGNLMNIRWIGPGRTIPILVFDTRGFFTEDPTLKNCGVQNNLACKVTGDSQILRDILNAHGFREVGMMHKRYNLAWTGRHTKPSYVKKMAYCHVINHFPRTEELTRKDKLYKNIIKMQQTKAKFGAYGLSLITHSEPVIYMQEDQPDLEIILGIQAGTRITVKLVSHDRKQECTEYCLIRCMGNNFVFLIRPPSPGFYKFQIYALPGDEAGPQMLNVYNYLIHFPGNFEDKPFPHQYPLWKDGCYLEEPLKLPHGIKDPMVRFKVFIPKAKDVQVKVGEEWNPLQQTEPGMFEGLVDFSTDYPTGSKAKLHAKITGNAYSTLLEYPL